MKKAYNRAIRFVRRQTAHDSHIAKLVYRCFRKRNAYEERDFRFKKDYLNDNWPPFSFSLCDNSVEFVSCVCSKKICFMRNSRKRERIFELYTLASGCERKSLEIKKYF